MTLGEIRSDEPADIVPCRWRFATPPTVLPATLCRGSTSWAGRGRLPVSVSRVGLAGPGIDTPTGARQASCVNWPPARHDRGDRQTHGSWSGAGSGLGRLSRCAPWPVPVLHSSQELGVVAVVTRLRVTALRPQSGYPAATTLRLPRRELRGPRRALGRCSRRNVSAWDKGDRFLTEDYSDWRQGRFPEGLRPYTDDGRSVTGDSS